MQAMTPAQTRAQVEGEIVTEIQNIEGVNGDLDFVRMQEMLALLGLQNQDGIFRFPPHPEAKGHSAVQAACHSYANRINELVRRLSMCDPVMRQNVLFGGTENQLMTSNPDMLKYLDRLFLFVSGAQSFLMSISSALLPCLEEAQYDRWKLSENVSDRWAAAMHENELRNWTEGRYQPHQMLIRVLQKRLALGDGVHSYVLYHDQVYRRKYIEHRQPLVKGHPVMVPPGGNQYVCAHCGKPEDEHCNNSVRDRKSRLQAPDCAHDRCQIDHVGPEFRARCPDTYSVLRASHGRERSGIRSHRLSLQADARVFLYVDELHLQDSEH